MQVEIVSAVPYESLSDSVGLEKKNAQWYIVHRVEKGETLYRISRRYHVAVDRIEKANDRGTSIAEGQLISIPYSSKNFILHKVSGGETLYSISRRYNISVDAIKNWNQLTDNSLSENQVLEIYDCNLMMAMTLYEEPVTDETESKITHVVKAGESLYSISRKYDIEVDSLKLWNGLQSNDISPGQILIMSKTSRLDNKENVSIVTNQGSLGLPQDTSGFVPNPYPVIYIPFHEERGIAELIDGPQDTSKFLALHRTASPGTILLVRNEFNNQVVFVRVIGKLPDTGANDKLVVKISRAAWENINAVNRKLRVKISSFR